MGWLNSITTLVIVSLPCLVWITTQIFLVQMFYARHLEDYHRRSETGGVNTHIVLGDQGNQLLLILSPGYRIG